MSFCDIFKTFSVNNPDLSVSDGVKQGIKIGVISFSTLIGVGSLVALALIQTELLDLTMIAKPLEEYSVVVQILLGSAGVIGVAGGIFGVIKVTSSEDVILKKPVIHCLKGLEPYKKLFEEALPPLLKGKVYVMQEQDGERTGNLSCQKEAIGKIKAYTERSEIDNENVVAIIVCEIDHDKMTGFSGSVDKADKKAFAYLAKVFVLNMEGEFPIEDSNKKHIEEIRKKFSK